jgi:hypothetical protein
VKATIASFHLQLLQLHPTKIIIQDKCYEQTEIEVGKSVAQAFWYNIFFAIVAPVAMGIDYLDGKMWKLNEQILVPLKPKKC